MTYDPANHHRRLIRLKGYDYSQPGAYFMIVCTQQRECLFGDIVDGNMVLNNAGMMIQNVWDEIPPHYSGIETDEFIAMPNHVHGIVLIVGATPCGCPAPRACPDQIKHEIGQPQGSATTGQPQGVARTGQAQGPAPTRALNEPIPDDPTTKPPFNSPERIRLFTARGVFYDRLHPAT